MSVSINTGKQNWVERIWYGDSLLYWLLLPLTGLFSMLSSMRRFFYRAGILTTQRVNAPVVVVGAHEGVVGVPSKRALMQWRKL